MTNVLYVKNIMANCDGNMYLPILHLPRVELHCKLQEKLHCVTGPLETEGHIWTEHQARWAQLTMYIFRTHVTRMDR